MSTSAAHTKLVNLLKPLTSDDNIWLMHLMNKDDLEYRFNKSISNFDNELIENDVDLLNSIQNTQEIKKLIIDKYSRFDEKEIENFIDLINRYLESNSFRSLDLLKYTTNGRFLNFSLSNIEQDLKHEDSKVKEIKNSYFKFIYIASVFNNTERFLKDLNYIERKFSDIMLEKSLHFKNYDHIDFYIWVINSLKEDKKLSRRFDLDEYHPIQDSDFKDTVLSVFDKIYDEDKNAYQVLKDKISNAWYQKSYRQKNKGKKHFYFFTDKTTESLKIMALKENLNEEKILEKLINQHYSKHYVNQSSGKDLYSLT